MHSFLFRMPLVINLRKILPTKSCLPPCGYRSNESNAPTYTWIHGRGSFTSRHNRRSRDRSHWQKTQALRGSRARHGRARTRARHGTRACLRRGSTRLRWRTDAAARSRDRRSHGPAPTHDSLRRNDETAGYARALCVAASRISPTLRDISRLRGEQTRHASPSNTVMRLKRI